MIYFLSEEWVSAASIKNGGRGTPTRETKATSTAQSWWALVDHTSDPDSIVDVEEMISRVSIK